MIIAFAPFWLKDGITEEQLLAASDAFQKDLVSTQPGILRRTLVRNGEDGFADIVLFEDLATMDRVLEAEQNSAVCAELFSIMEMNDDDVAIYEVLKTHES